MSLPELPYTAPSLPPMHALVAFEALARLGQVRAAALELGITPSALIRSIDWLEHRLRLRLFLRQRDVLTITVAGRAYYTAVQTFARTVADGLFEFTPLASVQLRVSSSPALARLWIGPRLARFRDAHPRIGVALLVEETLADVPGHQVDVALRYGGEADDELEHVDLWQERLAPHRAPRLLDDDAGDDPARWPLIEHAHWPWRDYFERIAPEVPKRAASLVCHDVPLALQAALSGLGVALLPVTLAAAFVASGQLRRVGPGALDAKCYRAVVRRDTLHRPAVAAFVDWLRREAAADAGASR